MVFVSDEAMLDIGFVHRVATATIGAFIGRIGAAITHPAPVVDPAPGDERLDMSRPAEAEEA